MPKIRACGALIAVVLVTLLLSHFLQHYWVRAFVDLLEPSDGWLSPRWLAMTWGWEALVSLAAGLALAALLPANSKIWWYVGLGALFAVVRFLVEGGFKASDADPGFNTWRYGSYVVTVLGATVGGLAALASGAWRRRLTIVGGDRESR